MFVAHSERTMRNAKFAEPVRDAELESSRILLAAKAETGRLFGSVMRGANAEAELIVMKARAQADAIIADARLQAGQILGAAGIEINASEKPSVIDLIRLVASKHGVTVSAIKGSARHRAIVAIRHEAMAFVYKLRPDLSLPQIGRVFNRDHTTILHAVRKLEIDRPRPLDQLQGSRNG